MRLLPRTFAVGHRYALRLRARDAAGNWSPWVSAPATSVGVVQDTSRSLRRSGTWRRALSSVASGGSTIYTATAGSSLSLAFTGRGIAVVAPKSTTRGRFAVWLDGVRVAIVDEHASSLLARRVVYARAGLADAPHTIRLVALATAGRPRVDVDALLVFR